MKIAIFTFYYPPDLSAGSFRAKSLVEALSKKLNTGDTIDIITTNPNRYSAHNVDVAQNETIGPVTIYRLQIPAHTGGMLGQSYSFLHFTKQARSLAADKEWDVIIGTSSRLFTAALATHIAKKKKKRAILDIRDIFSDTLKDVLSGSIKTIILPIIRFIEHRTIAAAAHVNLVSAGFLPFFKSRNPDQNYSLYTNGIDSEFITDWPANTQPAPPYNIFFAGNIGEGQGLHKIVAQCAAKLGHRAHFHIIGAGGRLEQLRSSIQSSGVSNVTLHEPVSRDELTAHYHKADILFLHLNDYSAFEKVIPSKVFEYAATGKPILAGIAGYGAKFIGEEIQGASTFTPCDSDAMIRAFDDITGSPQHYDREAFIQSYSRVNIMENMASTIMDIAKK